MYFCIIMYNNNLNDDIINNGFLSIDYLNDDTIDEIYELHKNYNKFEKTYTNNVKINDIMSVYYIRNKIKHQFLLLVVKITNCYIYTKLLIQNMVINDVYSVFDFNNPFIEDKRIFKKFIKQDKKYTYTRKPNENFYIIET